MKIQVVLLTIFLAALCAVPASAADISGKWVAQIPGRGGTPQPTTFSFKVDGGKLTGTVTTMMGDLEISEGKVGGEDVSFATVLPFGSGDMKFVFTGRIAGDGIKFKREMKGGEMGARPPVDFTAKRAGA